MPDFCGDELTTSSVIVARSVEQVAAPPTDQEANPYVFGPMRIVPSPDGKFSKSAELSVIFWIYGARQRPRGKPDVTIDYNFHQQLAEGEKYFNKTAPQQLNAQTLPPEFSVAAGHQLPGSLVVPLASFPPRRLSTGDQGHRQGIGKTVKQNANFQRSGSSARARAGRARGNEHDDDPESLLVWCRSRVCATASLPAFAARPRPPAGSPAGRSGGWPGDLRGLVQDDQGQPLAGAIVSALGSTSVTAADDRGRTVHVPRSPAGPYLVRAHLQEYVPRAGASFR